MSQNTGESEWLIGQLTKDWSRKAPPDASKIKLNQLVSKLGFFYEKLRNAIDYNEEHLIRRGSLKRLLNRQVKFLGERDPLKVSETIIFEFIRAKYLPNDTLAESDIESVGAIVAKYLLILQFIASNPLPEKTKLGDWAVDLMVCEIDEFLFPNNKEMAIINFMYHEMVKSISFAKTTLSEDDRQLQIYIAVLKNLIKADQALIRYLLLKLYITNWNSLNPDEVKKFCQDIWKQRHKIESTLNNPSGYQLTVMLRSQAVYFNVLRQLVEQNPTEINAIFADENLLSDKTKEICAKNYKRLRGRLVNSIIRVIIYIFFTKTVLAFILELPYDKYIAKHINWNTLAINIAFHPLLMTVIALAIKVPGDKNTQMIVDEVKKIVYGQERKLVYKAKKRLGGGSAALMFFNLIYAAMFIVSFGAIIYFLHRLGFNWLSGALFIFFLTLVSFFGFRLRNFANQYLVLPRKENLRNFLVDVFTLPIVRVGKFFSSNFSKINIFLYILDFIIETPFKILVELLDKALSFISEKREEIS
jgi:hypothetical protein